MCVDVSNTTSIYGMKPLVYHRHTSPVLLLLPVLSMYTLYVSRAKHLLVLYLGDNLRVTHDLARFRLSIPFLFDSACCANET